MDNSTYDTVTVNGVTTNFAKILPTENGKTYTLSATLIGNGGSYYYYMKAIKPDGTEIQQSLGGTCAAILWYTNNHPEYANGTRDVSCYFTTVDNAVYMVYFPGSSATIERSKSNLTISNYQMEEGTTATAYEPYQNLYLPSGQ